jgi:hypothetical protein
MTRYVSIDHLYLCAVVCVLLLLTLQTSLSSIQHSTFAANTRLESCIPQQSNINDCTVFTGLLSVYGADVTGTTLKVLIHIFQEEFPSFVVKNASGVNQQMVTDNNSTDVTIGSGFTVEKAQPIRLLIQYGVTRLSVADAFIQILNGPLDPSNDERSSRTIFGYLLVTVCILVALFVVVQYVHIQRQIHRYDESLGVDLKGQVSKQAEGIENGGILLRLWALFGKRVPSDMTVMSSSSSSSVSSWSTSSNTKNGHVVQNIRALCHASRRNRRRTLNHELWSMDYTAEGTSCTCVQKAIEPDSIYIVEPDEDDLVDDNRMNLYQHDQADPEQSWRYSNSNLSVDNDNDCTSLEERYDRIERDPLYVASTCRSQIGFEVS